MTKTLSHNSSYFLLVCTIFMIVGICSMASQTVKAEETPKFWLSNLKGELFQSNKAQTPYVISFFYVDCLPCLKEIPELYKLLKPYNGGVALLFIDPIEKDNETIIKAYSERLKVPLDYFYHDPLSSVARKFFKEELVFPTIILVKDKKIVLKEIGLTQDFKKKLIKNLN